MKTKQIKNNCGTKEGCYLKITLPHDIKVNKINTNKIVKK